MDWICTILFNLSSIVKLHKEIHKEIQNKQ